MRRAGLLSLTAALALCGCANEQPTNGLVTLKAAQVTAVTDGKQRPTAPLQLPLHWDVTYRAQSGNATLVLEFPRPPRQTQEPYALFIMRIGNAYSIALNDVPLAASGELDVYGDRRATKQPVAVGFPASLLQDQNTLVIRIRGDGGRRAGVAPIVVGPARLIEPLKTRAEWMRVTAVQAAAVFSLMVSAFCLLLWFQQREKIYAWASIGEAMWAVIVADVIVEWWPLPWRASLFLYLAMRMLWLWSLYAIAEQVFGARPTLERRLVKAFIFAAPVMLAVNALVGSGRPGEIWRGLLSILWVCILVRLAIDSRRQFKSRGMSIPSERNLLLIANFLLLGAGVHDAFASNLFSSQFTDSVWVRYMGALLGFTIMWIVSKRFLEARRQALELNASLARRIDEKEHELRQSFERLSAAEQARAVVAERERILRDMHDGVGANLATAMRQLESGNAPTSEVAATLRESLDHLKLSIDAMNLPAGDVNALLASLRYRLQPRIESAGLLLEWQVDPLPHWPEGTDQAMRHLQFLLLEAMSNVLQHAQAKTLTLGARKHGAIIELTLRDDGRGIGNQRGRGLQSMRERAAAVGATLEIEAATPGTCVKVTLPTS